MTSQSPGQRARLPRGLWTIIVICVAVFLLLFCGGLPIYFFVCKA